jgi:serine/threonine-protein kinase
MERKQTQSTSAGSTDTLSPAEELLVEFIARRGQPDECTFQASAPGATTAADPAALEPLLARLSSRDSGEPRYRVDEELARGGMGVVYKVWDPDLRRHVAMKVLRGGRRREIGRRATPAQERSLGRFLEEAQITGQLEHPGIVPVHELGLDAGDKLYFTMPLVRGRELKHVIELARECREGWNLTRALGVMLKVCEAVAYAHSKGVIHRDLKPSNIMVGRFGETYVMDWGLARVLGRADSRDVRVRGSASEPESGWVETDIRGRADSTPDSPLVTVDGAVIGTPAYMAPEQALGHIDELGPRADVYSIGAMLYHLLTGQMPYVPSGATASPHSVLAARLLGPPKPVLEAAPETAPELAAICEKAMHVDVEQRYASAIDLAADIEAFLGDRRVSAFDSSLGRVAQLAFRRNRALCTSVAAALLVALGWGAFDVASSNAAVAREGQLRTAAQLAQRRAEELADFALADVLARESEQLFPVVPERAAAMRTWIERADGVLARAAQRGEQANAALGSDAELASFRANLERLASERPRIAQRLTDAESLVARTIDARAEGWHAAVEGIASLPVYRGLRLAPQPGLVPLQNNPTSGLWEFWVDGTGVEPVVRDLATGALERDPAQALVLVLIPGGKFTMGSTPDDPNAGPDERAREVTLAPYFLGRTEVWQGLWQRALGENPAEWREGVYTEAPWTPLLPVEYVDWHQCESFLSHFDLTFPTEAQWEFAARAGESKPTIYGCGDDVACLAGHENILDQSAPAALRKGCAPFIDDHQLTAPVASFEPNPFGLHDMLGNVAEWCADWYVRDIPADAHLGTDGLAPAGAQVFKVFRGGSYWLKPPYCRIALRQTDQPSGANQTRGLRVARAVR